MTYIYPEKFRISSEYFNIRDIHNRQSIFKKWGACWDNRKNNIVLKVCTWTSLSFLYNREMLPGVHHIGRPVHFSLKKNHKSSASQSNYIILGPFLRVYNWRKSGSYKKHLSIWTFSVQAWAPRQSSATIYIHSSSQPFYHGPGFSHFFQKKKNKTIYCKRIIIT